MYKLILHKIQKFISLSSRAQSRDLTKRLKSIREMFRLRFNPLFAPPFVGGEQCST